MLFWLKEEANVAGETPDIAEYAECLENLGEAGYRGNHLVLGDRATLTKVAGLDLSRRAAAYFRSAVSKYSTLAGVARQMRRVFVSTGCHAAVLNREWTVPLTSFADVDSLEPAILVVEHMYDYDVMQGLAELHLIEEGLSSLVNLKLFPAAGGGGGTHLSLSTYQRDVKRLGMCVTDSDRAHVLAATGTTAKACENVFVASWRWGMHIIAARELENLIPPEILDVVGVSCGFKHADHYTDHKWPVTGYADLKLGDSLCRFRRIPVSNLSHAKTSEVLSMHFKGHTDCGEIECSKAQCQLCEPQDGVLARVAAHASSGQLRSLRRVPRRVSALSSLLSDLANVGAAAGWRIT